MPVRVIIASASVCRRWRYVEQLRRYQMEVATADDGVECPHRIKSWKPDVVVLESMLFWGGSLGVLAVRSVEPELQRIPIVLVAVNGVTTEWNQLAEYSVQGLLNRCRSGRALATALQAVAQDASHGDIAVSRV